jgi:uncharacterized protein
MNVAQLYRRQGLFIHIPTWSLAVAAFLWLSSQLLPIPADTLTISAGRPGGMYQEHALQYAQALRRRGVEVKVLESAGTGENLLRLADDSAQVQAAFIQGGYALSEANPALAADLETIAQIDIEPVWVFTRLKDLDSLHRLQGTRVAIGQLGSGSRAVALRMLEQVRLEPKDLVVSETVGLEAVAALREGRIDAMIFVASPTAPLVQALLKTTGVQLAALRRSAAMTERLPYLDARFVAEGSLNAPNKQPAQDTVLLSTQASLVVRKDLHPMLKRVLADASMQLHSGPGPLHRAGEFPHLKRVEFLSSQQAREVLRNGLPWIEDHLSVQAAQWAYRVLFIGIPLALLAALLSRIIPFYLHWRMESSINRWYGELKFIENDLKLNQMGGLEMARFRSKLSQIDKQASRFAAPPSYFQRLYLLKQHVQFVHQKLLATHGR